MMRRERTSAVPVSSPTGFSPKPCTAENPINTLSAQNLVAALVRPESLLWLSKEVKQHYNVIY